jgi:hypothetical protein
LWDFCSVVRWLARMEFSYSYYSDSSLLTTFVFSQPLQTYVPETRITPISVIGSGISTACTTTTAPATPGNTTQHARQEMRFLLILLLNTRRATGSLF